ncbi:hypothetical protein [Enteractinococcus helveticum]|uniref:N-acetyltransferase domain-containing protein n=1 Tax=Enteractinococcus helveticum TaxID=1837282 RepID=A0A1B7LW83_9MICC|nr:hypothetical protein [Enteractinococcus helveticum]OAV59265.1 hypothetical protein A6F49_15485 [Enteractinococcus helveticum]
MSNHYLNSPGLSNANQNLVLAAWARSLDIEAHALHRANDDASAIQRFEIAAEHDLTDWDPNTATFIQLFNISLLYAPTWFLDAARNIDDDVLALESTMLQLGYEAGARSLGEEVLYYAEDIPYYEDAQLNVTSHSKDIRRLEAACPPDDIVAKPLDALDHYFTISAFGEHSEPIAGAGYDVFSDTVGQLAVLVAAAQRTKGYGTFMLARVAEECMFDGLIPQWVTPVGDEIGEKMANDVGFILSGYRTSVTFA